jgi:hypothetical protein
VSLAYVQHVLLTPVNSVTFLTFPFSSNVVLSVQTVFLTSCTCFPKPTQRFAPKLVTSVAVNLAKGLNMYSFKIQIIKISDEGRTMTQADSRRPLTVEARVRAHVSPCDRPAHSQTLS